MPTAAVKNGLTSLRRFWRLDIKASDNALEKSVEENDRRENICARALILGLFIEVVFAFWFRDGKTLIRTWSPVFADVLVAGGVLGEVHFASKIGQASTELRRRATERLADAIETAGEANERAGHAELQAAEARERAAEVEKLTAWRTFTPKCWHDLVRAAESCVGIDGLKIEWQNGDAEAFALANEIAQAFFKAKAGGIQYSSNSFLSAAIFGVYLLPDSEIDISGIVKVFVDASVYCEIAPTEWRAKLVGSQSTPKLYIFVGPKPPPKIEFDFALDHDENATADGTKKHKN